MNDSKWIKAADPGTDDLWITAQGYVIMACTAFRLEDRSIQLLVFLPNEKNQHPFARLTANGERPFVINQLKIPELFVANSEMLNLPKVWWTGDGWLDEHSRSTFGPTIVERCECESI